MSTLSLLAYTLTISGEKQLSFPISVRFRALPITTELKAFSDAVDVYMLNPNRTVVRRWLSKRANLGKFLLGVVEDLPRRKRPCYPVVN